MAIKNNLEIDKHILKMKSDGYGLGSIQKWCFSWNDFQILDEEIVLAHILNLFKINNIYFSKEKITKVFLKYYKQKYHGNKGLALNWFYFEFCPESYSKGSENRPFLKGGEKKLSPPLHYFEESEELPTNTKLEQEKGVFC